MTSKELRIEIAKIQGHKEARFIEDAKLIDRDELFIGLNAGGFPEITPNPLKNLQAAMNLLEELPFPQIKRWYDKTWVVTFRDEKVHEYPNQSSDAHKSMSLLKAITLAWYDFKSGKKVEIDD